MREVEYVSRWVGELIGLLVSMSLGEYVDRHILDTSWWVGMQDGEYVSRWVGELIGLLDSMSLGEYVFFRLG